MFEVVPNLKSWALTVQQLDGNQKVPKSFETFEKQSPERGIQVRSETEDFSRTGILEKFNSLNVDEVLNWIFNCF